MNSFGRIYKLCSFGESHGHSIGGIIEGIPAGIHIDINKIQEDLNSRRPGYNELTSERQEPDKIEILSGLINNQTLGTPIGFVIKNLDSRNSDYQNVKDYFRPSHADFTTFNKYGIRDYKGGGRSSAREMACRVVAGSIANQILKSLNIEIFAFISQIGSINCVIPENLNQIEILKSPIHCPIPNVSEKMIQLLEKTIKEKNSIGGEVTCICKNVPVGLGEPIYDKLSARLAQAMFSINGVKGFEIGSGFSCIKQKGSEHNDSFILKNGNVGTLTNNSGGIQGGISNGEPIVLKIAFKPTSSIASSQISLDINNKEVEFSIKGRHDPCIAIRAVPVVIAMAACTIFDFYLLQKLTKW